MKYPSIIPRDTSLEAFRTQLELYRRMPPEVRLQLAFAWSEQVWELSRAGIRSRHPEYSDRKVELALIRLRLGNELFAQVYPGVDVRP